MKNNRKNTLIIISGIFAMLFVLTIAAASGLVSKFIQVNYGVKIYIDDVLLDAKDANGNSVEAFIYNGTTYLPIRAVGEAVGKTVQWDGSTFSAYLGKHAADKPAVWIKDLDYFNRNKGYLKNVETQRDNVGDSHYNCVTSSSKYSADCTYILNGEYSKITGTFFILYENRDHGYKPVLKIYGDNELLYEAASGAGVTPIDFSVDLTGVLQLKIELGYEGYLGECGLWT